jgi:hypothetical protein
VVRGGDEIMASRTAAAEKVLAEVGKPRRLGRRYMGPIPQSTNCLTGSRDQPGDGAASTGWRNYRYLAQKIAEAPDAKTRKAPLESVTAEPAGTWHQISLLGE